MDRREDSQALQELTQMCSSRSPYPSQAVGAVPPRSEAPLISGACHPLPGTYRLQRTVSEDMTSDEERMVICEEEGDDDVIDDGIGSTDIDLKCKERVTDSDSDAASGDEGGGKVPAAGVFAPVLRPPSVSGTYCLSAEELKSDRLPSSAGDHQQVFYSSGYLPLPATTPPQHLAKRLPDTPYTMGDPSDAYKRKRSTECGGQKVLGDGGPPMCPYTAQSVISSGAPATLVLPSLQCAPLSSSGYYPAAGHRGTPDTRPPAPPVGTVLVSGPQGLGILPHGLRPAATVVTNVVRPVSSTPVPIASKPLCEGRIPGSPVGIGVMYTSDRKPMQQLAPQAPSPHLQGKPAGGLVTNLVLGAHGYGQPVPGSGGGLGHPPVTALQFITQNTAGGPNGTLPLGILQPQQLLPAVPGKRGGITQVQYILPTIPQQLSGGPAGSIRFTVPPASAKAIAAPQAIVQPGTAASSSLGKALAGSPAPSLGGRPAQLLTAAQVQGKMLVPMTTPHVTVRTAPVAQLPLGTASFPMQNGAQSANKIIQITPMPVVQPQNPAQSALVPHGSATLQSAIPVTVATATSQPQKVILPSSTRITYVTSAGGHALPLVTSSSHTQTAPPGSSPCVQPPLGTGSMALGFTAIGPSGQAIVQPLLAGHSPLLAPACTPPMPLTAIYPAPVSSTLTVAAPPPAQSLVYTVASTGTMPTAPRAITTPQTISAPPAPCSGGSTSQGTHAQVSAASAASVTFSLATPKSPRNLPKPPQKVKAAIASIPVGSYEASSPSPCVRSAPRPSPLPLREETPSPTDPGSPFPPSRDPTQGKPRLTAAEVWAKSATEERNAASPLQTGATVLTDDHRESLHSPTPSGGKKEAGVTV
ncbi:protein capicua homolog [Ascaphus truei]|uniref:protein capicua homolog n=1 Tax=Ascaphus truei TaxID=8439 RepID=UPI003F5A5EA1